MKATDAAEMVLLGRAAKPLHYKEIVMCWEKHYRRRYGAIVDRIKGKTMEATMAGRIGAEVRHRKTKGYAQRFHLYGEGRIGLLDELEERLLKQAKEETPERFEMLVERLLIAMGFEDVEKTARGPDGGIDVRGTLVVGDVVSIRMAVQAKRYNKGTVSAPVIRQVRGSLGAHEQGLVITTGTFSKQAKKEAARRDASPVALMDGRQLAALLARHNLIDFQ